MAPSKAHAFVGEGLVINPLTEEITGPAKTIITNPTFLTESVRDGEFLAQTEKVVEGAQAIEDSAGLVEVMSAAGAYPLIGGALAFGAGVGIGTAICDAIPIFGTCLNEIVTEHQVAAPGWTYFYPTIEQTPYHWSEGEYHEVDFPILTYVGVPLGTIIRGTYGCEGSGFIKPPEGHSWLLPSGHAPGEWCVSPEAELESFSTGRSYLYGKDIGTGTGGFESSIGQYYWGGELHEGEPNPNWERGVAEVLEHPGEHGITAKTAENAGQDVAAHIPGSGIHNPYRYGADATIPDCDELTYGACAAELEERELEPVREDLDWSEVDGGEPEEVRELDPEKFKEVEKHTKVKVKTNPEKDGMPLVIPKPGKHETYGEYITKLAPGLNPERKPVGELFAEPSHGPDGVLGTNPDPGTRLDPKTEHEVDVRTNPDTTPDTAVTPFVPPTLPAIDLSPLTSIHGGCTSFPFGAFCWFGEALTNFGSEGTCPSMYLPIGAAVGESWHVGVDFCEYEPVMSVWRQVFIFFATIGVVMAFAMRSMGLGSGVSDD